MSPKVLLVDIETSPVEAYVWGLQHNDYIAVNQIKKDWFILSWAAKWLGDKQVIQKDQRRAKDMSKDAYILSDLRDLLDKADIVVTQNGKKFDIPKINARLIQNKIKPPSSFQQIDTRKLAKKHFGFTSASLEYMTDKLCVKYKKLKHKKFPGQELWTECLKGNQEAWKEMAKYNKHDVLALEELYIAMRPWDNSVNFNVFYGDNDARCTCGSPDFRKNGYTYSSVGKYQRYECTKCGSELKARTNLLEKPTRDKLLTGTKR